ncbi:hypothetical protein K474DRAFT_1710430 [Panus rudis PR-1116 ss-1]|nr:hypothetical protein K474DRAFT_1710430 [Panus rudis PR-1116 ss-1]
MIAIQKPVNALFAAPQHRSSHCRHPSAPVVVRPTHTPGLLSLSKPAQPTVQRSTQTQHNARAPKAAPKSKNSKSTQQPAPASHSVEKPTAAAKPRFDSDKAKTASADKSARGRQSSKPASKDKADRRSSSLSSRPARRPSHQPSPPPPARIPNQTDAPQSVYQRDSDSSNFFDPFVVPSPTGKESSVAKSSAKPVSFRPLPELARPSGKLARRRQNGPQSSPTPSKAVPVPRNKEKPISVPNFPRSDPTSNATPRRPATRRASTGPALGNAKWDSFPICDDSDDFTPPTTPVRESASVPAKVAGATWQQQALFLDEAPRTAPLSSTFGYPFTDRSPLSTPSPAQRRRHHHRVPSEGMFAMSTDEDSSSSDAAEDGLKAVGPNFPKRRAQAGPPTRRTPSPAAHDIAAGVAAGFYAGSVFQNSPSPDELPVPAFAH